jgi:hypothetical protein
VGDTQVADTRVVGTQVVGTRVGDTMAADTRVVDTMVVGTRVVGTMVGDTLVVDGIQVVTTTATARAIMAVGTADGGMATIPAAMGGDLGTIVTRVGRGLFRISIPIPMAPTILTPIPIPIPNLHRRSPSSLPRIANRSNRNPTTGITARTRKATTHTSKTVRAVG